MNDVELRKKPPRFPEIDCPIKIKNIQIDDRTVDRYIQIYKSNISEREREIKDVGDNDPKYTKALQEDIKDYTEKIKKLEGIKDDVKTIFQKWSATHKAFYQAGSDANNILRKWWDEYEKVGEDKAQKKYESDLDKLLDKRISLAKEANKYVEEAESLAKKMRSESNADVEMRKNKIIAKLTGLDERKFEVLNTLEYRALETEEDYQREADKIEAKRVAAFAKMSKTNDQIRKLEAEYKKKKSSLDEQSMKYAHESNVWYYKWREIYDEAKKKGFKVKRDE